MQLALVDLDIIIHKVCFYHQYRMDENDPELRQKCRDSALDLAIEWCTLSGAVLPICVYTEPGAKTFRHLLCPDYKANRKDKQKPIYRQDCIDYVKEQLGAICVPELEADDVMGLLHMDRTYDTVLVTTDKDLLQVPGIHFNPDKDWSPSWVPDLWARRHLYIQAVMGDATDNIPGIRGMGIKKAERFVDSVLADTTDHEEVLSVIENLYLAQGYSYEDYKLNYDLVKIYTTEDEWHGVPQLKQYIEELIQDQLRVDLRTGRIL